MIQQAGLIKPVTALDAFTQETDELIAIVVANLKTTLERTGLTSRFCGSVFGNLRF